MQLATVALVLMAALPARANGPFASLSFDDAAARAKAEGKLLIVDFTATWCPPCKQMEHVTWPDAKLGEWLAAHAIAIQVDIDPGRELAQRFEVESVPTVIVFRDATELDRHSGFQSAAEIIQWGTERLGDPQDPAQRVAEILAALAAGPTPYQTFQLGQKLVRLGQFEEATQVFLRSFEEGMRTEQRTSRWRLFELVPDMANLAAKHPPASEAFAKLVAAALARVCASDPPGWDDWCEWTALCDAFEREEDVLRWYEERRDDRGRLFGGGDLREVRDDFQLLMRGPYKPPPYRGLDHMRDKVVGLLAKAERFEEAVALLEDPPERAREQLENVFPKSTGSYRAAEVWALAMRANQPGVAEQVLKVVLERDKTGEGRANLLSLAWYYDLRDRAPCVQWRDEAIKLGQAPDEVPQVVVPEPEPEAPAASPPSGG